MQEGRGQRGIEVVQSVDVWGSYTLQNYRISIGWTSGKTASEWFRMNEMQFRNKTETINQFITQNRSTLYVVSRGAKDIKKDI